MIVIVSHFKILTLVNLLFTFEFIIRSNIIAEASSLEHKIEYVNQISAWPILIGYRCESCGRELAENGANILEANTAVRLTLFGESFSTDTIVGFTNELEPAPSEETFNQVRNNSKLIPLETRNDSFTNASYVSQGQQQILTDQQHYTNSRFKATNVRAHKFDCTDYDRVRSYKLTKENLITPNVAQIVVNLPEPQTANMLYYFCLKQPLMQNVNSATKANYTSFSTNQELDLQMLPITIPNHIWVHQGGEWFVTLKVETPLLTPSSDIMLICLLLFLSAVTSGLNLGLMSLDMNELAVISSCGDQRERSYARTIAPLRERGNYLLCSLLLGNVLVNSSLTVILEDLTSGLIAIIGSTLAIVVLGEILPQAFCARKGLAIGAKTIYLTYAFMIVTFPLSYPISCLLDWVLGKENGHAYDRERLMEFIRITGHHTQLEADEVAIISGALKLKKIKVDQIMTRIEDVFMLPIECKLDRDTIKLIIQKGYSRIPVYESNDRRQIVALILAKDLALLDPDDHTPVENMLIYCKHPLIFIQDDTTLDVALNEFKTGKSHMAVVRQLYDDGEIDKYYEAIGVVTLEDVIEEVLQAEINDETDTLSDNRRKRRRTDAQVAHLIDEQIYSHSKSICLSFQKTEDPK